MGQEASIPTRDNLSSPQAVASPAEPSDGPSEESSSVSNHNINNNNTTSSSSQHPQARSKKPPPTAPSMISRSGITSMIQRMGVPSQTKVKKREEQQLQQQQQHDSSTTTSSRDETIRSGNLAASGTVGALVGKMTDLVLGDAHPIESSIQPPQPITPMNMQQPKTQPSDEDDWEKAWAEDSESDEEEDSKAVPLPTPTAGGEGNGLRLDAISPVGHVSENSRLDGNVQVKLVEEGLDRQLLQPTKDGGERRKVDADILAGDLSSSGQEGMEDKAMDRGLREEWEGYHHEIGGAAESEAEKPCVDMFDPALRVLGRGSFGRVVLVQKRYGQSQGGLYAMKILRKSHLVRRRQIDRTKTERKVLSMLNHPFIMKLYYAFQTSEKLYLVLDYCPGGELFFHLSRYRRFQEPVARFYAAELLLAIGHLHKNGIIYRDLKPENVLLDAYGHVKLGDFGLAKDGIRHPTQGAKSTCGTPEYMAPEVLNQTGHGFCVDYWGLGMILYEMMTGLPPWYTTDRSKLFRRLKSAPLIFPNEVQFSPHCKACIAGLLERDPRLRLGVLGLRSAMRHEFFYRRINFEALRACQMPAPIRPCEGWRQFANKNNSIDGSDSITASLRGHSAGPSFESAAMGQITMELLDVATENFDDTFRRMPIETEDYEKQQQAAGHAPITEKELNEKTFRGFTFDGDEVMDVELQEGQWKPQQDHQNRQLQPQQQLQHQQRHHYDQSHQQTLIQQNHAHVQLQSQERQNQHSHNSDGSSGMT